MRIFFPRFALITACCEAKMLYTNNEESLQKILLWLHESVCTHNLMETMINIWCWEPLQKRNLVIGFSFAVVLSEMSDNICKMEYIQLKTNIIDYQPSIGQAKHQFYKSISGQKYRMENW